MRFLCEEFKEQFYAVSDQFDSPGVGRLFLFPIMQLIAYSWQRQDFYFPRETPPPQFRHSVTYVCVSTVRRHLSAEKKCWMIKHVMVKKTNIELSFFFFTLSGCFSFYFLALNVICTFT